MTTQHPITTAAAQLVQAIDATNDANHRQDCGDPAIAKIIVGALRQVNESGANFLCKLSPAQCRAVLSQRRRRRHDADDAGDVQPIDDLDQ